MRQLSATVHGGVQGVGFRASARYEALRLGLKGWVKNNYDGSVEILAVGPQESLEDFLAWCRQGPRWAQVERVDARFEEATTAHETFHIRRTS